MHSDATGDLAGGNFQYIAGGNNRKGHNVVDLLPADNSNLGTYGAPPGKYRPSTHSNKFSDGPGTSFSKLTCAGAGGCHGTRNIMTATNTYTVTNDNGTTVTTDDTWGYSNVTVLMKDIPAISGAHHLNYDGLKEPAQVTDNTHRGTDVANGYRFIPGLIGYGSPDRWVNREGAHNEYFGKRAALAGSGCSVCHVSAGKTTAHGRIQVPNQTMSGFCGTCHGAFHSVGDVEGGFGEDNKLINSNGQGGNGIAGAFQRHPSDYVIKNSGEYSNYTDYEITAPVARQSLAGLNGTSNSVAPGSDMVMCLSCHMAHAAPFDSMLRFDYDKQQAGGMAGTEDGKGCLACHTAKGKAIADKR
jgi:hypothetical protein